MKMQTVTWSLSGPLMLALLLVLTPIARGAEMPFVRVADDRATFTTASVGATAADASAKRFTPWGFNYDHDETGRLIEDYWVDEWPKIVEDFKEMKALGANVVRIHIQFGKFMTSPDTPNDAALEQLGKLLRLAEDVGLYIDLTGLGCYHKKDVPAWYDALSEEARWAAQAKFWEAVAARCAASPAVFCYDLMNEPVVSGGKRAREDWLGPGFGDKHFVQFINLTGGDRARPDIARAWIHTLVTAIRKHDKRHLITVGLVPWSLDRPGLSSGFPPDKVTDELDFIAVHLYPEKGKRDEAMATLKGFAVGKPVIIEETFTLKCGADELAAFIDESKSVACGWIGFYWGRTPEEIRALGSKATIGDAITLSWLELFEKYAAKVR